MEILQDYFTEAGAFWGYLRFSFVTVVSLRQELGPLVGHLATETKDQNTHTSKEHAAMHAMRVTSRDVTESCRYIHYIGYRW